MEEKAEKKCDRKNKFHAMVCEEMEDKENCLKWVDAMQEKCKANSDCKIDLMGNKMKCSGAFRAKLMSFRKEEEVSLMGGLETSALIGSCFTSTLDAAETCKSLSKTKIESMLVGVNVPSEELIKEQRKQFKEMRKGDNRPNRRNNKNRWDQRTRRWDNR